MVSTSRAKMYQAGQAPRPRPPLALRLAYRSCGSKVVREIIARKEGGAWERCYDKIRFQFFHRHSRKERSDCLGTRLGITRSLSRACSVGRVLCLEYRVSWVRVPPEAAHFF